MGWYNKPDLYVCLVCGTEFEYLNDTVYKSTNGECCCPSCNSFSYKKIEKDFSDSRIKHDFSFDFETDKKD